MSTFGPAPSSMDSLHTLMKAAAGHSRYASITAKYISHPGADTFEVLVKHMTNTKKAADREVRQVASNDLKMNQFIVDRASAQTAATEEAAFRAFKSNKDGNRGGGDGGAGKDDRGGKRTNRNSNLEEKAAAEAFKKEMATGGNLYPMPSQEDARATGRMFLGLADQSGVIKERTTASEKPRGSTKYYSIVLKIWRNALEKKGVTPPAKPEWMRN